ncbi:hypothetical protein ABT272_42675 [Streptomyces sp900105245]|uniref:Integral membrane protein n=1 Tax=Streptomyces sp. 900105245 TaxID=3154379 RepID=A0ABV1UM87_9ACTN
MTMAVALGASALMAAGWGRLRYWRRFSMRRQSVVAVVFGVSRQELRLRLAVAGSGEIETVVSVGETVAADWERRLELGGLNPEEPDFEDPSWDQLLVSYSPSDSPQVMTCQQIEDARMQPVVLVTTGSLILAIALLSMIPAVFLCLLGVAEGVVAAVFVAGIGRRQGPVRGGGSGDFVLGCGAMVMGVTAVTAIWSGLTW